MTREQHLKFCTLCKNRKNDYYGKGVYCGLTNEIADFEESCASFISDDEAVQISITQKEREQEISHQIEAETPPWRTVLSVIIAVIAVIRLIVALNR